VKFEAKRNSGGKPGLVALTKWCAETGVTACTAWRWRRAGMLRTVNVSGRVYVTQQAIADFTRRAEAGEFAAVHPVPTRSARSTAEAA